MSPINRSESQFYISNDVDLMSLAWARKALDVNILVEAVAAILALAAIFVLLILLFYGIKRRPRIETDNVGQQPVLQEGLQETPQLKRKVNVKRLIRRSFRLCCVQTQAQKQRYELQTRKRVAVRKEHSQRELAEWTKAREQNAQRKKEKLEQRLEEEYDRIQEVYKKVKPILVS